MGTADPSAAASRLDLVKCLGYLVIVSSAPLSYVLVRLRDEPCRQVRRESREDEGRQGISATEKKGRGVSSSSQRARANRPARRAEALARRSRARLAEPALCGHEKGEKMDPSLLMAPPAQSLPGSPVATAMSSQQQQQQQVKQPCQPPPVKCQETCAPQTKEPCAAQAKKQCPPKGTAIPAQQKCPPAQQAPKSQQM